MKAETRQDTHLNSMVIRPYDWKFSVSFVIRTVHCTYFAWNLSMRDFVKIHF